MFTNCLGAEKGLSQEHEEVASETETMEKSPQRMGLFTRSRNVFKMKEHRDRIRGRNSPKGRSVTLDLAV